MNARQIYRYLFSTSHAEENIEVPTFFDQLKYQDTFRSILRFLNASTMELNLYGNNTDDLTWFSYFAAQNYAKDFEKFNHQYKYFTDSVENVELFRRLYYVCKIILMKEDAYNFFDEAKFYAYQIMIYFCRQDESIENNLEKFDLYCNKNNISELSILFPKKLRASQGTIQLLAWQNSIVENNTPEAMILFNLSTELEKFSGCAPNNIHEAKQIFKTLLDKKECSHQELVEMFSQITSETLQSIFIASLSEKNFFEFIPNTRSFYTIFSLIKYSTTLAILLERIDAKLLQSDEYSPLKMLRSVDVTQVTLIIKKVGIKFLLQGIRTASQFSDFIKYDLPSVYDKLFFFTHDLSREQLQSYIDDKYDLINLIQMIHYEARLNFLLNSVGKEKCAMVASSAYELADILDELKPVDRFEFIKAVKSPEDLHHIRRKEQHNWKELTSKLQNKNDKATLNALMYSEEDLNAKSTLKSIKHTIQKTKWSFRMFETVTNTTLGTRYVEVPKHVGEQIEALWAVSQGKKSPSEGLAEIKKIGNKAAKENQNWGTTVNNLFFAKNETQKYFDKFENEEVFRKAFVAKK